ncbi:MAG: DNA-binding HxlR family transcriptional regulator [Candidatus Pelagisphaera sp.]|jgi:DNA-binding HxlR family transcriptional regulator
MGLHYGQFCPIAKAAEILGERWTILILRELICGSTRFNQLQRGLSQISPTLLTKRLNQLVDDEIVFKKTITGQKRVEYHLTPAGKDLTPVIMGLGDWGMKWTRSRMEDDELDVELLMLEYYRRLDLEQVPGGEVVAHFAFSGLKTFPHWWIKLKDEERELCIVNPGCDVDVTLKSDLRTMTRIWAGELTFAEAKKTSHLQVEGRPVYTRSLPNWLKVSPLARPLPDQSEAGS